MALRTLGRSGLLVSPFTLGAMTMGNDAWGSDETASGAVLDAYLAAGGNAVDTADVYSGGRSEEIVGRLIAARGLRDHVVLATKYGFHSGGGPLTGGAGRKNAVRALEGSLRRLGTDSVDLYWLHVWDDVTPAEEVLTTMTDLVRAGKVAHWGLSDVPAWFATQVATLAAAHGEPGPVALQLEYSLVARSIETEHVRAARELGTGIVPWSPLAGGFLSGKYSAGTGGRLSGPNPFGSSKDTAANRAVVEVVREVAAELGLTPAQLSLAWVLGRPGVDSVLVGARTPEQVAANLVAGDVELPPAVRTRLDEVSAPDLSPAALFDPAMMAAVITGGTPYRRLR
ncbi:aldo/keto reductase [Geodermatophilus sp. Leaf369]|uniref:aldo/keto reductase n=1 Tax=Geodermatophilus sp. Leaf369 TaxID=1736354 RepID=UPI0006F7E9ED|nr:aldo/keto reductase [Geodermatophilus sp. Leaf369]KQS54538.1 aldo/keto reductase [Geodermatophilus sp. Leaf369]